MLLFKQLTSTLNNSSEFSVVIITDGISLVCAILQFISEEEKKLVLETMSSLIKDWINNPNVIGEKMFGYDDTTTTSDCPYFSKGTLEMRVSLTVLSCKAHKVLPYMMYADMEKISFYKM